MAKISHVEMRELNVVAVWRSVLSDTKHDSRLKSKFRHFIKEGGGVIF